VNWRGRAPVEAQVAAIARIASITPTSALLKPDGASASTSRVSFTFTPRLR
jgi:hypothetical protein